MRVPPGYRYIQDVMFSADGIAADRTCVGLKRGDDWVYQVWIGRYGMIRWVAAPDEGIISTDTSPVIVTCDPPAGGATAHVIFDVEPDRTLHPASWRDYRIEWGRQWDDPDNEIPWWRKRPHLVAYRRRVKRAKMFAEYSEWVDGCLVTGPSMPLDPRDEEKP